MCVCVHPLPEVVGSEAEQPVHDCSNKEQLGPDRGDRGWAASYRTLLEYDNRHVQMNSRSECSCAATIRGAGPGKLTAH